MAPKNLIDQFEQEQERLEQEAPTASSEVPEEPTYLTRLTRETVKLSPEEAGKTDTTHRMSLAEARDLICNSFDDYLADPWPNEVLLIRAAAGVGKTYAAVRLAEQQAAEGKKVLYAGPRHDFYTDIMAQAEHPNWWYEWLPRQEGNDVKPQTCLYTEAITRWINKGYDAMTFCSGICGWDYVGHGCPYHQQKARSEKIIYGQHAHVMAHPLHFDIVIGDENPTAAFLHEWKIEAGDVLPAGMDYTSDFTHMLHQFVAVVAMSKKKTLEGPELLQALGGAQRVLDACRDFRADPSAIALAPKIHDIVDAEKADLFHLPALVGLLVREAQACLDGIDYLHRVIARDGKLALLLRNYASEELPPYIIWLDATGEPHIYEELFGRPVRVVNATPELMGEIYQVTNRTNGKGVFNEVNKTAKSQREQLAQQIASIKERGYKRPALITFQQLEGLGGDGVDATHFYANRGTNRFEQCDALVIAGAPLPALSEITKMARMIFFDRISAFNDQWSLKAKAYEYVDGETGAGVAREIGGYWEDPDLAAVLWSVREAELIQAAHRVRPVQRQADIWLLTNIPIDGLPPTRLLDLYDLFCVPQEARDTNINPFMWRRITQAIIDLTATEDEFVRPAMVAEHTGISLPTIRKVWKLLPEIADDLKVVRISTGGRYVDAIVKRR